MIQLVIGGAASGKSEFAEQLVLSVGDLPRYYIATMQPFDDESVRRIEKHRQMRAKKSFTTVECYTNLASVTLPERGVVLLECMSNLAANEKYSPDGAGENALAAIADGVAALERQCERLIIVSNEVFSGGNRYEGDTDSYLRLLAEVNRMLAARADMVVEVVCGLPQVHKGEA